jgi:hypothetical protein
MVCDCLKGGQGKGMEGVGVGSEGGGGGIGSTWHLVRRNYETKFAVNLCNCLSDHSCQLACIHGGGGLLQLLYTALFYEDQFTVY